MLVCSVSQLRRRASIAAGVVEAAIALDAPGTGNVVFAALVDDPASVGDHVDAFLGQIMLEAASAAASVNAGLAYAAAVVEAVTAIDAASASRVFVAAVAETGAATDIPDASLTAATVVSASVLEAASAADTQDATVVPARSAMIPEAFVNPSAARQANVAGTMVNL